MPILSGPLTVRRFRVIGNLPEHGHLAKINHLRDRLDSYAFSEHQAASEENGSKTSGKAIVEGWVQVQNFLDTSFEDTAKWAMGNSYVVFALRTDKKSVPAKLLKVTVQKKAEAWCKEQGTERCPSAVRKQIRDELEFEWLKRALPKTNTLEAVWNVDEKHLLLHTLSENATDSFRKRFLRTFGLKLVPSTVLDNLGEDDVDALLSTNPTNFMEHA